MTVGEYIRGKAVLLVMMCFFVASDVLILSVYSTHYSVILLINILLFFFLFLSLGVDFYKKRKFYNETIDLIMSLEKKNLLCTMLPDCEGPEERIVSEIIQQSQKSMNDEIVKYKKISAEYREYIEMWIHEVKTPIAAAKLVMENSKSQEKESVMEELNGIEGYVEQALYYARSNSVAKDYMVRTCLLSEIVNEVIRKNRKHFIRDRIGLNLGELQMEVYTDSKWAEYIVNQIVVNAIKYRKEQPEIAITCEQRENQVILRIQDNGLGISGKDLPRVFEKGYTGEKGRQLRTATGMGLYLVKKLCDKLGLGIVIESKRGVGTTVSIVFPTSELVFLVK